LTSLTVGSSIGRDELSGKRLYSSSSICQATPRKNETVNPPEIKPKKRANEFSVDRSGLLKSEDLDFPNEFVEPVNRPDKEELTPLAIDLYSIINLKGPITLHEFMSEALNHTVHGYYQAKNTEKIGAKGDFVTSPEISQLFGEMLGIWIYSTWEAMGSPSTFHLIEFGPGKGTLMVDMLTVLRKFPKCLAAVEVHFVELSLRLRQVQYDSLQKKFSNKPETEFTNMTEVLKDQQRYEIEIEGTKVPLVWNSFFRQIPSDQPCIIIGQEFLDAFPVHQFIYTKKGWREKLVDIDRVIYNLDDDEEFDNSNNNNEPGEKKQPYPFHFRLVTSPRPTAAVQSLISSENPKVKQFRESLKTSGASFKSPDEAQLQEGDGLEIAPLALIQCEDVAMRITKAGGACLFIDYGEDFAQEDTLRGFKKHKQVPFLSEVIYSPLIYYECSNVLSLSSFFRPSLVLWILLLM
jgi:NADH dehydrogenase [ubiquinone] 1 alpha subcomplex assembly factor 7